MGNNPVNDLTVEIPPEQIGTSELPPFTYDNLTKQQRERDNHTTTLYRQFVKAHEAKVQFAKNKKGVIFYACIVWVSVLIIACVVLSFYVIIGTSRQATDVIALISTLVPLITAIVGTLNIVTKYVFPEDEDKNITEIVKIIHENDLKNKQENIKSNGS